MPINKFIIPYILPKLELQNRVLLVGSSESLLNNFGELIDSYENIIRFNRAPVKNYEKHVGTRRDFRILNNHVFDNVDPGNEFTKQPLKFVKKLSKTNIIRIGPGEAKNKSVKNLERKENKVFIFEYQKSEELKNLINFQTNKNMSVGAVMIGLCLLSGLETSIIGFDLKQIDVTHYWEKRPNKMSSSHDFSFEKGWLNNLVDNGLVSSLN